MTDVGTGSQATPGVGPALSALARRAKLHRIPDAPAILKRRRLRPVRAAFYTALWRDAATAIGATHRLRAGGLHEIRLGRQATYVRGSELMLDSPVALALVGERALSFELIAAQGLRVPAHLVFHRAEARAARTFHAELGGPVVVKPLSGTGGGRGVTTGIQSREALDRAIRRAGRFCPEMIVEEQVPGAFYRLTYLDGRFLDAVRRDPPTVTGDGRSTIRALVSAENRRRRTGEMPCALNPLLVDAEMRGRLAQDGRSLRDVPATGEVVVVKGAVNESGPDETFNVTRDIPAETIEEVGRMVDALGIRFAGVDVMAQDISAPLGPDGPAVIEVNGNPGLHHHALLADPSTAAPVARMILEHLFETGTGVVRT
jgi:cyanophycin synthetase